MKWQKFRSECTSIKDVVLANTCLTEKEFLNSTKSYTIKGIDRASEIIKSAISSSQKITVIADYDADGICSGAILKLVFDALKYEVTVRIPRRFSEGYGLSEKIIDEIDSGLLITVDNGISASAAIQKAKDKGLTVIVTDHHLATGDIPIADVVIDPNALPETATFNGYCGAGIAYKLAVELLGNEHRLIPKLTSLVAIATIADVTPLVEENRILVQKGLKSMVTFDGRTTGLGALLEVCEMDRVINEKNIAFKIAPIINAAGRMSDDGAMKSFNLLSYNKRVEIAKEMAEELYEINEKRKKEKEKGLEKLTRNMIENCLFGDKPLCIYEPGLSEGLVGIFAGSLAEEYKTPCFVFTDSEDPKIIKGSGRSYGGINLKGILDENQDVLYKYGGHTEAAGVSLLVDNYELLRERLAESLAEYDIADVDTVFYDIEIGANDIPKAIEELKKYAPYGEGNPEVRFKVSGFMLSPGGGGYYRTMGADEQHIKLLGAEATAVGFGMTEKFRDMGEPKILDLIGMLSENYFMGRFTPQIELVDMVDANKIVAKTPMANILARMAKERY